SRFRCHLRMEEYLEEQVAQLVADRGGVAGGDRVQHLTRLLDQKRAPTLRCLLAIPRTSAGGAPAAHHPDEGREVVPDRGGLHPRDGTRAAFALSTRRVALGTGAV